jgi:hypothetical protein
MKGEEKMVQGFVLYCFLWPSHAVRAFPQLRIPAVVTGVECIMHVPS